jgi:hypothetical protein
METNEKPKGRLSALLEDEEFRLERRLDEIRKEKHQKKVEADRGRVGHSYSRKYFSQRQWVYCTGMSGDNLVGITVEEEDGE